MSVRLYMDEDSMDQRLMQALRARGVDVQTVLDTGRMAQSDEEQLVYAAQEGRAVYSFNVADFYQLHTVFMRQGRAHAGIILTQQQRYSVGEQMRRLLALVASRSAEEMQNHVEFLSNWERA